MHITSRQSERRGGFTLVELLVAVSIFVLLTALTVGSFNLNLGNERISAASRQMQGFLEGARSRAFKLQRPVGVRFMLDPNFPGEVNTMMLVSSVVDPGGDLYQRGYLRFLDLENDGDPSIVSDSDKAIQFVRRGSAMSWLEMRQLDMLRAGMRIRIPAETGSWYSISSRNFLDSSIENGTVMQLNEVPLDVAGWVPRGTVIGAGTPVSFEIDLTSVMVPLAGEEPQVLATGTCVDLRSSKLPSNWNINRWQANQTYAVGDWVAGVIDNGASTIIRVYRAEAGGLSGGTQPIWKNAQNVNDTIVDNGVTWRCYATPQLDVIFTPQGTVYGRVAAEGLLHFTLAETRDTRAVFENDPTASGGTTVGLQAWDVRDHSGDGEPDHIGSYRVVTVFTSSGAVNVSPIDQTDANSDGIADNLFEFAIRGSVAR
ncbi:pilus assembly FimT family protein [Rubinisphaera margarita]|uniref:pilus assembly FimT family protein n=1 Tax=Rubinisphaera margarita TaxID=2909586 RepID=UPI001EE90871|nr:prepilin-type N-terminal cleavage/methylation domain-containing protein [Rubinisphaera margarita]MCG6154313.1 prepilin-type N-terminal cleavage/methylation domain-containing protein [Rubinisphaera margarita]